MLGVGLLGVAASRDPSLAWLWDALAPLPPAADDAPRLEFEHVVDPTLLGERPRQTSFDVLVDDPAVLIGIETKWREHGVGTCLCRGDGVGPLEGEHCSRRVEQRDAYWEAAADVLGLGAREPGGALPDQPGLRGRAPRGGAARAGRPDRPAVLALALRRRQPLLRRDGRLARLAGAARARRSRPRRAGFRFAAISWQELVPLLPLDEPTRAWAADKHGLD